MRPGSLFLIGVIAAFPGSAGADRAASFPAPSYPELAAGLGGGFTESLDHRCRLPEVPPDKLPYPAASGDMGDELCKHHVWKLLLDGGAWNQARGRTRERWIKMSRVSRLKHLGTLDAYFLDLDTRFKAVLDSGRAVLDLYESRVGSLPEEKRRAALLDSGLVDMSGPKGPVAGKPFVAFHDAVRELARFASGPEELTLASREDGLVAPEDVGSAQQPGPILRAVARSDEALGSSLVDLYARVQDLLKRCQDTANQAAAESRLDGKDLKPLNAFNEVDLEAEGAAGVSRVFDRAVARGELLPGVAASLKRGLGGVHRQDVNGRSYIVQDVRVPDPHSKSGYYTDYAAVELREGDTLAAASERLAEAVSANEAWMRAFAAVAREVVRHPARAAKEAVRRIREDQGWFPLASAQTRGALQRRFDDERSDRVAEAGKARRKAQKELRGSFERAKLECARLWAETERVGRAVSGDPAALKRLEEERAKLRVAGPKPGELVPCARDAGNDMAAIKEAYAGAFHDAADAYAHAVDEAGQKYAANVASIGTTEREKRRVRRVYFRRELLEVKAKGDLPLELKNPELKDEVLQAYFAERWSKGKSRRFYLEGWTAPPADSKQPPYVAADADETDGHPLEDAFIARMAEQVPYWNRNPLWKSEPPLDREVLGPARKYIQADFESWCRGKGLCRRDPLAPVKRWGARMSDRLRLDPIGDPLDVEAKRWKRPSR